MARIVRSAGDDVQRTVVLPHRYRRFERGSNGAWNYQDMTAA